MSIPVRCQVDPGCRDEVLYSLTSVLSDQDEPEVVHLCRYHLLGSVLIRMTAPAAFVRLVVKPISEQEAP